MAGMVGEDEMTVHDLNQLSDQLQLAYVHQRGNYLARRWHDYH